MRVQKSIKAGDEITKDNVQMVEVGGYNLPGDVMKELGSVVGAYATADLLPGDYVLHSKISEQPPGADTYLYQLDGNKQAISVTVKSFAAGLSGKIRSGDIVSILAPDYLKMGETVIPQELQYVQVIAVTDSTGVDANTDTGDKEKEKIPYGDFDITGYPHSSVRSWQSLRRKEICMRPLCTGGRLRLPGNLLRHRSSYWNVCILRKKPQMRKQGKHKHRTAKIQKGKR